MTDDFQLFPDSAGSDPPVDADIALITAYLARELSLVQIVAVEERLATDVAFREKVRPVIEAWLIPTSFGSKGTRSSPSRAWETVALTRAEIDAGWHRHVTDTEDGRTRALPRPPARVTDGTTTRRRPSMARIAAVIAAITIPMVTVAQVVVYVAKRADAPGHSVAQRIVAPFGQKAQPGPATESESRTDASRPMPSPDDVPLVQPLPPSAPRDRSAPGAEPSAAVVTTQAPAAPVKPAQRPIPDRARIAALAAQQQPAVVRGETPADYIVMVLDAADQYVWSTPGAGNLSIEVAGDSRTAAERMAYTREHRAEYVGAAAASSGGGRGRGGAGLDTAAGVSTRVYRTSDSLVVRYQVAELGRGARGGGSGDSLARLRIRYSGQADSLRAQVVGAAASERGGSGVVVARRPDQLDSIRANRQASGARGGGGGGGAGEVGVAAGRGARGGGAGNVIELRTPQDGPPGSYRVGYGFTRLGETVNLNQGYGLQEPGGGQSGIQGLLSTSVSFAETYSFPAGDLAPRALRVVVVHLTPGTDWRGR